MDHADQAGAQISACHHPITLRLVFVGPEIRRKYDHNEQVQRFVNIAFMFTEADRHSDWR
jgi:hypothetical protein